MKIYLVVHPKFLTSQSMPRFANMIAEGMTVRGHEVIEITAKPFFYNLPVPRQLKKWMGYVDQFILFPLIFRSVCWRAKKDSIFVFADQALGPWVRLASKRPNVVHVHDFMALRSALGEFPENPVGFSGKIYQAWIRSGFSKGRSFISVSKKTESDLLHYSTVDSSKSKVIYNGLNYNFRHMPQSDAQKLIDSIPLMEGISDFVLHVGGNQWYKNRASVLRIYGQYVLSTNTPVALCLVGANPTSEMLDILEHLPEKSVVRFLHGISNEQLCAVYSRARLLLFPSIAEGFGWPIVEAMASGCLVLTTCEDPMSEIGGEAAFYVTDAFAVNSEMWIESAAQAVHAILALDRDEVDAKRSQGFENIKRFDAARTLDNYERAYLEELRA